MMALKVFTGTKHHDREILGERISAWLKETGVEVIEKQVLQSSDAQFHCLTICVWYKDPVKA